MMRGTPGYLAPKWLSSIITEKVDVHSFRVVVLEMLCGRKNLDRSQPKEDMHLLGLFKSKVEEKRLLDIIDKYNDDMQTHRAKVVEMMRVTVWCLQSDFSRRPSLSVVVKVLKGSVDVQSNLGYSFTPSVASRAITVAGNQKDRIGAATLFASALSGPRAQAAPLATLKVKRDFKQENHQWKDSLYNFTVGVYLLSISPVPRTLEAVVLFADQVKQDEVVDSKILPYLRIDKKEKKSFPRLLEKIQLQRENWSREILGRISLDFSISLTFPRISTVNISGLPFSLEKFFFPLSTKILEIDIPIRVLHGGSDEKMSLQENVIEPAESHLSVTCFPENMNSLSKHKSKSSDKDHTDEAYKVREIDDYEVSFFTHETALMAPPPSMVAIDRNL
ncbi:hypothetical protein TEA_013142 [Camellia sinensis var. sinensis]|uniref:Protein kinase domain-containing protein n=1 Tax=Camellia sinensis var. sinensis TaxID=542762 RepID=A0A4S4EBX6_CAMSN|nr:hypothetical protein TEA_013142 [Camellia sinensis var. sinensis]